jgi:hypothetical protein
MTSKEWEKHNNENDQKIKKKIKKYKDRSSRRVVFGVIVAIFGFDSLNDIIRSATKIANEYAKTVDNKLSLQAIAGGFHEVAQGIDNKLAIATFVVLLIALLIFIWAVSVQNKADALDTAMLKWMPDADEIADIKKRFDNEFVRNVLSNISAEETESVTVALEGIVVESNDGEKIFNFNKEGYKRLTNYETKQLAFYIGEETFPKGFIIHQLKKHATVYDNYVRGYTEVGDVKEKAPDETEIVKKNVRWLLKEISSITGYRKLRPKEERVKVAVIEGGHIVINKGYSENSEKYKAL